MAGIGGLWAFLFDHPLVGWIVFGVITLGVLSVLSGGNVGDTLGGMLRVAFTFFTTPFVVLRDALANMRSAEDEEQDYRGSRLFLWFRASKLEYLLLLIVSLLILSSGVTSSVLSLYPQYELAEGRRLDAEIQRLETEVARANEAVAAANAPGHRDQLRAQRDAARTAYQNQLQANAALSQNTTFYGGIVEQLTNAQRASTVENIRGQIDYYMSSCPRGYNWRAMTTETCAQYRSYAIELANARMREFDLERAAEVADQTYRQADNAAANAAQTLAMFQSQLDTTKQQRAAVSLFDPEVIAARLGAAAGTLLTTLLWVVIVVWIGAWFITAFSWLVLMMRGLERWVTAKLKEVRTEE